MVCFAQAADSSRDEPEEGRRVSCIVEKVGEAKSEEGEIVGGVYAGVDVPQEPFVAVEYSLPDGSIVGEGIAVVGGAKDCGLRCVYIVAFVELAFQIGQADYNREIVPDIAVTQSQCLVH